jgi:hypothetical protein
VRARRIHGARSIVPGAVAGSESDELPRFGATVTSTR